LKDLISKVIKNNPCVREHEIRLKKHKIHQKSCWHLYHTWGVEFVHSKKDFLCLIHDKMNHSKTALLQFQVKNKMVFGLVQLLVTLIGMIVHGHGDETFVQHLMSFGPMIVISRLGHFCTCFVALKKI